MAVNLQSLLKKKFPSAMNTDIISEINYLDTGIPSLNYVISGKPYSGGLPLNGKITLIYGVEGASKSTLAIHLMAEAEKKDYSILYIDTECSITEDRIKQFGVDKNNVKFMYATPDTMEEAFEMMELVCKEKIKEQDDTPLLIVWDSVGSSATEEETNRTAHDIEMASSAKVLSRDLKRMIPILHKLPHTGCLFIQQSRQNMSLYGDTIKLVGGQQILHSGTVIIRVGKSKPGVDGQGCIYGTTKNKLFNPFQKTELHLDYALGFTNEAKITAFCDILKNIGLLVQSGSYCGYSDELKKIILDNGFNKRITTTKVLLPTPTKTDENGNTQTLAVDGYKIEEKEEILFDVDKKFYMKDFVKQLIEDKDFYKAVVKSSEEFIQNNIVFVTEQCTDKTNKDKFDDGEPTRILTQKTSEEAAEEMFKSIGV